MIKQKGAYNDSLHLRGIKIPSPRSARMKVKTLASYYICLFRERKARQNINSDHRLSYNDTHDKWPVKFSPAA